MFFPFLFSPLSFFSFECVHPGLLQVDYNIIGIFFPPFFWAYFFPKLKVFW